MSQFSQYQGATTKVCPMILRGGSDTGSAEIGHIPQGLRIFSRPATLLLVNVATATVSSSRLADMGKSLATQAGGILRRALVELAHVNHPSGSIPPFEPDGLVKRVGISETLSFVRRGSYVRLTQYDPEFVEWLRIELFGKLLPPCLSRLPLSSLYCGIFCRFGGQLFYLRGNYRF